MGEFEQLLLFALVRLEDGAHGRAVRREIGARTGRPVSPGAVYTGLDRLESRGYVTSWIGEETPARGGRRRKHYRLERAGARALARTYAQLTRMAAGVAPRLAALAGAGPKAGGG